MSKQYLVYKSYSDTIRQKPENYCIAVNRMGRWFSDPDLACNQKLAVKVFKVLFNYSVLYGTGENLIKAVRGN